MLSIIGLDHDTLIMALELAAIAILFAIALGLYLDGTRYLRMYLSDRSRTYYSRFSRRYIVATLCVVTVTEIIIWLLETHVINLS